jgi:hypothetical protein
MYGHVFRQMSCGCSSSLVIGKAVMFTKLIPEDVGTLVVITTQDEGVVAVEAGLAAAVEVAEATDI